MTDLYNFPDNENIRSSLSWMGENYTDFIVEDFTEQFRLQDPQTEIIAIKNEAEPVFRFAASDKDGLVHGVNVKFKLQLLLKAGDGKQYRIFGLCTYDARELDSEERTVNMEFDVSRSEEAL